MTSWIDRLWYGRGRPLWLLYPLAWLYRFIAERRRRAALEDSGSTVPVPVVVVGNITAGGTGKSPLTAMLARLLQSHGWEPVILTRGYGGKSDHYPLHVLPGTPPSVAGDEPVMLADQADCPVVVDPDRRRGALWALGQGLGTIMICDDGLQHYLLPRDIELAVFDGQRGLGNGAIIPVGPLRELPERLDAVDFVITNGGWLGNIGHPRQYTMNLVPTTLRHLLSGRRVPLSQIDQQSVLAVAGIGNPARFFDTLRGLGASVTERPLPDHHPFKAEDLRCEHRDQWLVMTAKDAVKCRDMAPENAWVLDVVAELPESFESAFMATVNAVRGSPEQGNTTNPN